MAQFNRASARRIAQATRRLESTPRNTVMTSRGPRIIPRGAKLGVVTQAVGLRSGTTMGAGKAQLQRLASTSPGVASYTPDDGDPVWVFSGATGSSNTIAVGRLVVLDLVDGLWVVTVDFCA